MKIFSQNIVSARFVELVEHLIRSNTVHSKSKFAQSLGIKPQTLSEITSGRRDVTIESIRKLFIEYPNVEANWLLKGEGDMIKDDSVTVTVVGLNNNVVSNSYNTHDKVASKPEVPKTENELQAEITYLKRQLDLMQDVVRSKEETIEVLKSMLK